MAKGMTKTQKQLTALGGIVAVIIGVVILIVSGGGGSATPQGYRAKAVSTELSDGVFAHPEFKRLQSPVALPLTPGAAGRENPFEPFN